MAGQSTLQALNEEACLSLLSGGGIGRLAYVGRFGLTVFPVNYKLYKGDILFRTAVDSPLDEDLRTGIADAEYKVAFEVDQINFVEREGWSVLVQGAAHHVDSEAERASLADANVEPWPSGSREHFIRITPTRITGRSVTRSGEEPPA